MSKFKNTEELEKAYKELEKEFTKKSQKLAIYEKDDFEDLYFKSIEQRKDLEAKLAESEEKYNKQWLQIQADTEHIQRLEQQLAELNKEPLNCSQIEIGMSLCVIQKGKITELETKLAEYEKFMKDNEWSSIEEMQETLNKCEKKYLDMQQQLAESEETIKYLKGIKRYDIGEMLTENTKLKQQLEEKEKELLKFAYRISEQNEEILELASKVDWLESEKDNLFRTLEEVNEDKGE